MLRSFKVLPGLIRSEILPMQENRRAYILHGINKRFNVEIIIFTPWSFLLTTSVVGIFKMLLVVGTNIEENMDYLLGVNSSANSVDFSLSKADFDSSEALITNTEDSLGVGDDHYRFIVAFWEILFKNWFHVAHMPCDDFVVVNCVFACRLESDDVAAVVFD